MFATLHAVIGVKQTHSNFNGDRPLSLVGCVAQQVPGKLVWDAAAQSFGANAAANALVRPFIRKGWEF